MRISFGPHRVPEKGLHGRYRPLARVAAGMVLVAATVSGVSFVSAGPARADESTISVDGLRTGWDRNEPGLAPSQVSSPDFGQRFSTPVDGSVYAQPLVVGSTVVVATENDKVYGLNADGGAIRWQKSLGEPWPAIAIGCGDLVPNIGVTGTPVYDSSTGTVYMAAKVNDGPDTSHPHWYLHALDVKTGAERSGWPVTIQGSATNAPNISFNAFTAMQRPGLLLMGGAVYLAFGSHCDTAPYVGWVVRVNAASRGMTLWTTEENSNNGKAGIWQSGGGVMSDGPGRVFVTSGNGETPPIGPGFSPPGTLSESVIQLGVNSDGTLSAQDFFAPTNANVLDQFDQDIGSGGPVGLPSDLFGTPSHPHLMVQVTKDGRIFLLDRDNLGGRAQGPGGTDAAVEVIGPYGGVWGYPGVWGGDGGYVYTVANNNPLRALKYDVTSQGQPSLTSVGTSSQSFGFSSGSPVITSTGTTSGSALVWMISSDGGSGTNGQLRAFDPVPVNGVLNQRWSAPIGTASKFSVPATDGGRVFVGTRDGHILAFGRPNTASLIGNPVDFGAVGVGQTGHATATVTAVRDVTVTNVTTTAPFGATKPSNLPVTLHTGATLSVPVSFSPTSTGPATGTLSFTTNLATIGLDMRGNGGRIVVPDPAAGGWTLNGSATLSGGALQLTTAQRQLAGSAVYPTPVLSDGLHAHFTATIGGGSGADGMTFTMLDATQAGPTALGSPGGGLGYAGLPGIAVTLDTFRNPGNPSNNFMAVATGGTDGSLTYAATTTAIPNLRSGSHTVDVAVSGQTIHVSIDGTEVLSPTVPSLPSTVLLAFTGGTGDLTDVHIVSNAALAASAYAVPPPSPQGWTLNGSATLSGGALQLTPAQRQLAGSAFFGGQVPSAHVHAHFTATIGGGSGADGMTFTMLDATQAGPTALGSPGGGLGYAGLPGIAVTLDTFPNPGNPSNNFMAVATGGTDGSLTYAATTTAIPNLRSGSHTVDVAVSGQTIHVSIDGTEVLSPTVPSLPPTVLVGFTGGTGDLTDVHTASAVTISY